MYTPEAIRRVGLYDERFVGICHHEGDYLLRASLALREAACIHDIFHHRVTASSSSFTADQVLCNSPASGYERAQNATAPERNSGRNYGCVGGDTFDEKWAKCRIGRWRSKTMEFDWKSPPYVKPRRCIAAGNQPRLYQKFEEAIDPNAPGY